MDRIFEPLIKRTIELLKERGKDVSSKKYILDENDNPVLCEDLIEWAKWFENATRRVRETHIGKSRISTVFLALDHSFEGPPPILYETMVFGGKCDQYQLRYATKEQAVVGHDVIVGRIQNDTLEM